MALSLTSVVARPGAVYAIQTDATIIQDTLKAGSGRVYKVEVDNTGNTVPVYVKLYDINSGVTHGSTHPNWCFKCPAGVARAFTCANGNVFGTGLRATCSTEAGTGTTTTGTGADPANDVIYRILLS